MTVLNDAMIYIHRTENKGTLVFHFDVFFFILHKTHKDILSELILCMTSMCAATHGHTGDDTVYLCSWNLMSFLLKCNTKFLEKIQGFPYFGFSGILLYACAKRKMMSTVILKAQQYTE